MTAWTTESRRAFGLLTKSASLGVGASPTIVWRLRDRAVALPIILSRIALDVLLGEMPK
jgi:hypothetical protein